MPSGETLNETLGEPARAKVNLCLHVVGKRADGYHLLDSLAVFPEIGDRLEASASDGLSLELAGRFGANLAAEPDNLVLRAARGLADLAGVPAKARLVLEKNLPVSSGIGGGSADAAAALRVLARLWKLGVPDDALAKLALGLGADVPVCLAQRPTRMQGVGEVLSAAPRLPECGMVLANPLVAVATPSVFKARRGGFSAPPAFPDRWPDAATMAADLSAMVNDLEAPAISLCPQIAGVLAALRADPACQLARMSGSGATCFGLYRDAGQAAAAALSLDRPGWWVWGGALPSA
jgi:4-diphosphocytidyl-2-C-methyl-D-erythritol kinase